METMLRKPEDTLANCCWLPRIIDKAREYQAGSLPRLYRIAFGSRVGIDGYFFRHFSISKAQFLTAVARYKDDESISRWFLSQPFVNESSISAWNRLAPHIGKKGCPGFITFHVVKFVMYPKAVGSPVSSIFEAIHQDETHEAR